MDYLLFEGVLFDLVGVILLAIGFRIGKPKYLGKDYIYEFDGKEPIVLYYENPLIRRIGWSLLILGYFIQIPSLLVS